MTGEKRRELYIKAIEACSEFEGKGKVISYTSVNGHMFSMYSKECEVGIRLEKNQRAAFLEEHNTALLVSYNTVMKEYVHVPDRLLEDTALIKHYLEQSFAYVSALKPKPTTKKKKQK